MESRRNRKSGARSKTSSPYTVAVFHGSGSSFFPVTQALIESASYRKHLKLLSLTPQSARGYLSVLTMLERLTHPGARIRRPARKEPPDVWKRMCFAWDFSPRVTYATRFVNATKLRLVSKDPLARKVGRRAVAALRRLLFEAEWTGPGRKPTIRSVRAADLKLKKERQVLLAEIQQICAEFSKADSGPELLQALRRKILQKVSSASEKSINRLLGRKVRRSVDVTNQVIAWKYGMRPAEVQHLTAPQGEFISG